MKEKILGKLVGSPNLTQAREEVAEWEKAAGMTPTTAETFTADPLAAAAHLETLGITGYVLPWHEDPDRCVCIFGFRDELCVTGPGTEADVVLLALHFVVWRY